MTERRRKRKRKRKRRLRGWVKVTLRLMALAAIVWLGMTIWENIIHKDAEADAIYADVEDVTPESESEVWYKLQSMKLPDLKGYPEKRGANQRIRTNHIGNYFEIFNDSNYRQYAAAEKLGIDPIPDIRGAYHNKRPLIKIESNEFYDVDKLTHSMPYLVPEAALLLKTIGRNFIDSVGRRGGRGERIIVTSLLRTPQTVKKLRRVNVNATDSSTHKFGTTFDISWSRYAATDSFNTIHDGDLKGVLAEVLYDLRKQNRCLVKYERKTACFHITVLP